MEILRLKFSLCVLLAAFIPSIAMAQNFSSGIGTRPSCRDSGGVACSGIEGWVNVSTICYEESECDYQGFTCKSNYTAYKEAYDELRDQYNELLDEDIEVRGKCNELLERHKGAVEHIENLEHRLEEAQYELDVVYYDLQRSRDAYDTLQSCVKSLGRFDNPQDCLQ